MPFNRQQIDQYAAGAEKLGQAIDGLSPADLNSVPVPGTWSIQQIVLHLLDSDLIASDRMKRVIAEDDPQLVGFDESLFAQNLFYDQLDAQVACQMFALNRRLTADILRRLPDTAFERSGTHNERGRLTLANLIETYAGHLDHHLRFVADKRRRLGK